MRYQSVGVLGGWVVEKKIESHLMAEVITTVIGKEEAEIMAQALNCQLDCDQEVRDGMIDTARAMYAGDEINIDQDAGLSEADDGCWVQAWVWIPGDDPEEEDE